MCVSDSIPAKISYICRHLSTYIYKFVQMTSSQHKLPIFDAFIYKYIQMLASDLILALTTYFYMHISTT